MARELKADELAWRCPEDWLPGQDSNGVPAAKTIVGQDRAVDAIAFGLAVESVGFNVFVTGLSGTGRLTTIKSFLDQLAGSDRPPDDVCFVYNFRDPEAPGALHLDAGAGRRLVSGMAALVRDLRDNLPGILGAKDFRQRIERAVADLRLEEKQLVETFEQEVKDAGFQMVQIQAGPVTRPEIVPVVADKPVALDELGGLVEAGVIDEDRAKEIGERHARLNERLHEVFQGVGELRRRLAQRIEEVQKRLLGPTFDELLRHVRAEVGDPRADTYLTAVREDLADNIELFMADGDDERLSRWQVNLAVDNAELHGRPVILETEPTYSNLFGTIERSLTPSGEVVTSFLRIRAGSLLRANGGFLVLNGEDLLLEPRVWTGLKRALRFRRVQIQTIESLVLGATVLKPEPVPLDVKVVVIGDRNLYDLLYRYDSDFPKVFKVLADFDALMPASRERALDVLAVLRRVSEEENLLAMDRSGMAAMLEEAVEQGRWRRRFSSRFSDLADLLRESSFRAKSAGAEQGSREHVRAARAAHRRRHALTEDRLHDYVTEGVIRVETEGRAIGQVNGLAVYDLGHHRFGKPSRITARVGLGREGIINIERQAGLSGPTHDKGVNILTGFLRGTFARRVPLTVSCSVTFEQSYGGIDGDSASSTEVYAIVSALADVPLRQDVAITGSVDQYGTIQAIGGVNEKIEGFFRLCESRGLSGTQGVLVPEANVPDIHLDELVVDAVADGRFHVWAASSIEQGLELLTGEPAGEWLEDGGWTPDSIYGRCEARLEEMVRLMRRAGKDPEAANGGGGDGSPAGDGVAGGGRERVSRSSGDGVEL